MCMVAFMALAACETKEEPTPNTENTASLTLTSEPFLHHDLFGGSDLIAYTLERGNQSGEIEVKCDSNWVTTTHNEAEGTIDVVVAFNNTSKERTAVVTATFGAKNFNVVIIQEAGYATTHEFEAEFLNGTYFGVVDGSDFNYFFILSDTGAPSSSQVNANSTMYRLDIYSDVFGGFAEASLPNGTFKYDGGSLGFAGTFADKYSSYMEVSESYDIYEERIIGGVIKIEDGTIDAVLRLQNNETHRVRYSGELTLNYDNMPRPPFSNLDGDYSFKHENNTGGNAYYYGDEYHLGLDNWSIQMVESTGPYNGDYVMVSILTPESDMDINAIFGEYRVWREDLESYERTFIPGYVNEGNPTHTYYVTCVEGVIPYNPSAPIADGTINIEKVGSKVKVTFDCVDDKGNKFTGSYLIPNLQVYPV